MKTASGPQLVGLPDYPNLQPIDVPHLQPIRQFTDQFDSYSDFNATSLWGWSASVPGSYKVARLGDNLVIEFGDYLTGERFRSLIGTDSIDQAVATLISDTATGGRPPQLRLVPEVTAALLDPNRWQCHVEPESCDYIYDLNQLAESGGRKYRNIRQAVNRFERQYAKRAEITWLDASALTERAEELLQVFDCWTQRESEGSRFAAQERMALKHVLETAGDHLPWISGLSGTCSIDGTVSGMWIIEQLNERSVCAHYQKVTPGEASNDLDRWIDVQQAKHCRALGLTEMNAQQDLGIDGLRNAKTQLRPSRMLRKFSVRAEGITHDPNAKLPQAMQES